MTQEIYGAEEMAGAISIMATDMLATQPQEPILIGIRHGGMVLADRLAVHLSRKLGHVLHQGIIDINLYRDDWTRSFAMPQVGQTELNFSLDQQRVILVDDVLFTGRTVRAALEALADFGRPARIELAVLVDRGHREMPIMADYAPFKINTTFEERINVHFQGQRAQSTDRVVLD